MTAARNPTARIMNAQRGLIRGRRSTTLAIRVRVAAGLRATRLSRRLIMIEITAAEQLHE
jgi:hypothetical protein